MKRATPKIGKRELRRAYKDHPATKVARKLRCACSFFDFCTKAMPEELLEQLPEQERHEVQTVLDTLDAFREYAVGLDLWAMEQVGMPLPTRQLEIHSRNGEQLVELKQELGAWYDSLPAKPKRTRKEVGK